MFRYAIIVRSWFDKVNGNSYYSLRVADTATGRVEVQPLTYGRGLGEYFAAAERLLGVSIESRDVFVDVVDVARRKDLHPAV